MRKQKTSPQAMSREAFEQGDWQAVIKTHLLESQDPDEWLRYGTALLQSIEPRSSADKLQQQSALAFVQAQQMGASSEAVQASLRRSVMLSLGESLLLAGLDMPALQVLQQHLAEWVAAEDRPIRASLNAQRLLLKARAWRHAEALHTDPALIKASILAAFSGKSLEKAPTDYAHVNQLREIQSPPLIEQWREGLDVTAILERATPLVLIKNITSAQKHLERKRFWIAYGTVGSTMVFNLLRILANSVSNNAISAWEGDLASPEKFFELVDESPGINLGVLKIHRSHHSVNTRLSSGEALAVLTHRDMESACYSYWRMLNNPNSPFFKSAPDRSLIDNFFQSEVKSFANKSQQNNTLVIRESEIRRSTRESIRLIAFFLGIEIEEESLVHLSDFLGAEKLGLMAESDEACVNSSGHKSVTYLHPGHIAKTTSQEYCSPEIIEHIRNVARANSSLLDDEGYCRPERAHAMGDE
jgi:hypothetical protein